MKFIDVSPDEIDNIRQGRRGRVSYPLLKGFLETGKYLVQVDLTGIQQSMTTLTSSLNTYVRNHELPIKIFQRNGKLYLMRLDVDREGNQNPHWQEDALKAHLGEQAQEEVPLTPETVEHMFPAESRAITK
jgi:hypothetical protein